MRGFSTVAVLVIAMATGQTAAAEKVIIGTGGTTGVYYATGNALCELLSAKGIACEAPSTGGSVANLKSLAASELTLAMAQSDWQFHAYKGSSVWKGDAFPSLRAVFSVYAEPIQIVANRDANIRRWNDLKGKRVNIGNEGSGHRRTVEEMFDVQRWKPDTFASVSELPSSDQVTAFCNNDFDAFFYAVGVPNGAMAKAVGECNGMLVEPAPTVVRKLASAARPYYGKAVIPAGTYWDGQKKVDTFGVMATLVATEKTDPKLIDALMHAVFDDFAAFQAKHPAYAASTPEVMVSEGLSAPLHPAAEAFYKEKGWVK